MTWDRIALRALTSLIFLDVRSSSWSMNVNVGRSAGALEIWSEAGAVSPETGSAKHGTQIGRHEMTMCKLAKSMYARGHNQWHGSKANGRWSAGSCGDRLLSTGKSIGHRPLDNSEHEHQPEHKSWEAPAEGNCKRLSIPYRPPEGQDKACRGENEGVREERK